MSALEERIKNNSLTKSKSNLHVVVETSGDFIAAAELAAITQRLEAAEAEREYYKNNASAWKEFAEHMEYCAVCAEDVDNCEDGSLLRSVAKVKIDDVILKGDA